MDRNYSGAEVIWRVVKRVIGWSAIVTFSGCVIVLAVWFFMGTPRPLPPNEVIGHWEAESGKKGHGDFYEDGTFVLDGLSFNIVTGKDAVDEFSARGTWAVRDGSSDIDVVFESLSDGGQVKNLGLQFGSTYSTLGWGKSRQLYFSDGEEINQFKMNRTSDTPKPQE